MKLRTQIESPSFPFQLDYKATSLSLGSCFAVQMADRMQGMKLDMVANPFGISYNPVSIARTIELILDPNQSVDIQEHPGDKFWHSFEWQLTSPDLATFQERIIELRNKQLQRLASADLLIITFGTAWVYRRKQNQQLVANCHKYPADVFEKSCLNLEEILKSWESILSHLNAVNPKLSILFTVSPVRHTKEGLAQNAYSKSVLRLAVEKLVQQFGQAHYFPAYEIMLDDLRDYRFYKEDLIHPSDQAVDYIWECFQKAIFNDEAIAIMYKWQKLQKSLQHKPLHAQSPRYHAFLEKLLQDLENLNGKIDLDTEIQAVKYKLEAF